MIEVRDYRHHSRLWHQVFYPFYSGQDGYDYLDEKEELFRNFTMKSFADYEWIIRKPNILFCRYFRNKCFDSRFDYWSLMKFEVFRLWESESDIELLKAKYPDKIMSEQPLEI